MLKALGKLAKIKEHYSLTIISLDYFKLLTSFFRFLYILYKIN